MKSIFITAALLGLVITSPVKAQSLADAMGECSKVENSLKRLVCYDRLSRDLRGYDDVTITTGPRPTVQETPAQRAPAASVVSPTAPSQTVTAPSAPVVQPADPVADFGLPAESKRDAEPDQIELVIEKVEKDARGTKYVLTLSGGQVWRQTDTVSLQLEVGERVTIEKGLLGSYFLGKEGVRKRIRVKRSDSGSASSSQTAAPVQRNATTPAQQATPEQLEPEEEFGLPVESKRSAEPDEVNLVVEKVGKDARGTKLVLTLSGGQVWRQTDTNSLRVEVGDRVTIEKGLLGAYYLGKEGVRKRIRVKREK